MTFRYPFGELGLVPELGSSVLLQLGETKGHMGRIRVLEWHFHNEGLAALFFWSRLDLTDLMVGFCGSRKLQII